MRKIVADLKSGIFLGAQGEDRAEQVLFPVVRDWKETYGEGAFYLLFLRPGEDEPYLCDIEVVGLDVVWTIRNTDVAIAGVGRAELQYYTGDGLAKSAVYITKSVASIGGAGEPPEPWSAWVENVIAAATRAENAATDAENQRDIAGEAAVEAIEAKEDAAAEKGEAVDAMEAAVAAKEAAIAAMEAAIAAKEAAEFAETAANFFAPGAGTDSIVQKVAGAPERGNINRGENGPVFGLRNVVDRQEGSTEGPSGIIMAGRENYTGPRASRSANFGHKNKLYAQNTHVSGSENTVRAPYADSRGHYTTVEETAECGSTSGFGTRVRNFAEEAVGKYNDDDPANTKRLFSIGNGTGDDNRHSAFEAGGDIGDEYIKVGDERMSVEELNGLLDYLGGQKLNFISNFNGTCFVSGIGNCTRKNVVVPPISPEGDTVVGVYSQAFQNNTDIETVKLPRTITSIGSLAFAGCSNLQEVYVTTYPNIPTVGENVFQEGCHVVVSQMNYGDVLDTWSEYSEQICTRVVHVKTVADLRELATKCNSEQTDYYGNDVILDADLDLSGSSWVSIGTTRCPFKGSFYGNGHTISGMTRSGGAIGQNVGLFGVVSSGHRSTIIKDFKLTGSIVSNNGGENAGTVVSAVKPSTTGTVTVNITGVWSAVNFDAASAQMSCVGGILGTIAWVTGAQKATINIDSCRYSGTLDSPSAGSKNYGGIMGYPKEACGPREINITNCIFDGVMVLNASSPDDNGGIMGYFKGNGSIGAQTDIHVANCIVAGQFQHTRKTDQTNTGYVVSEKSGNNTDYSVTNVYYCNDSDRHTGGAMGGWYGYMKGGDTDPTGITKTNVTAKTMAELVAMTSGFDGDDKWHFYNDGSNLPVPAAVFGLS